jgi:outer membrane biosynthesis protein TonB
VTAGVVLLVDAAGTSRVLNAGDAAVLGADGDLAGVDRVSEDELAGDPWAAANRALDEAVALDEEAAVDEAVEADHDHEDELEELEAEVETDLVVVPEPEVDEPAVAEEPEPEEESEPEDQEPEDELGDELDEEERWPPPTEEPEAERGDLLDELYAPADTETREVSGRSIARVLEIAALVVFVGVIVLLVFLFNRDDDGGPTQIANPVTTQRSTTTDDPTSSSSTTTSTTTVPPTVTIDLTTCTQKGESLVASGFVEGAPRSASGYRITVEVVRGRRVFGTKTIIVEAGDDDRRSWKAEIPLTGDAVGSGAECEVKSVALV